MRKICFISLPVYGYFNERLFPITGGGGAKRQIYLLATELNEVFDVSVIVGDYGQPIHEIRDGVTLYRSYNPTSASALKAGYSLYLAMKRAGADVYIYRGNPRKAAFVGLFSRALGKPWVYHVANDADIGHHFDTCSPLVRWLFHRQLRHAHSVVVQTRSQRRMLAARFGVDGVIVPNGYPPIEDAVDDHGEYFLWVGRLNEQQKRPHLVFECAERMPHERFVLIGLYEDDAYARSIISRSRSTPNVHFVGSVEPDEIHHYYERAIAVVNTSAYEGFPNTFLEAWRCETPVVSLSVDPGRFLHDGAFSGFADDDRDRMIELLERLSEDPTYRRSSGRELREYVEAHYDLESVSHRYVRLLTNAHAIS